MCTTFSRTYPFVLPKPYSGGERRKTPHLPVSVSWDTAIPGCEEAGHHPAAAVPAGPGGALRQLDHPPAPGEVAGAGEVELQGHGDREGPRRQHDDRRRRRRLAEVSEVG